MRINFITKHHAKLHYEKGKSASIYQFSTAKTAKWNVPYAPDISTSQGGIPIKTKKGIILGAIGVPSATDIKCAKAGLKATVFSLK